MDEGGIINDYKAIAARAAFHRLLADAEACKRLFEQAGLPLPESLVGLLHPDETSKVSEPPTLIKIPRPPRPKYAPRGSTDEWIYLPIEDAQETSLVLAQLNPMVPLPPAEVVKMIQKIRPNANKGTLANIGTRLCQEQLILRDQNGWMLNPEKRSSLVIEDDFIWGSPRDFQKQERAAFRRMAILHVLRSFSDGLQVAQLAKTLDPQTHCPWFPYAIPVNKFLLNADLEALAMKNAVELIGGSKKWRLKKKGESWDHDAQDKRMA